MNLSQLPNIEFSNGTFLHDPTNKQAMYEFKILLLTGTTISELFELVNVRKYIDLFDLISELPNLKDNKLRWKQERDELLRKSVIEHGVPCPRCKSTNTAYDSKQTRRGDEAPTVKIICGDCGLRKTVSF